MKLQLIKIFFGLSAKVAPSWTTDKAFQLFTTPRVVAKHKNSDALLEQATVFDVPFNGLKLKGYSWGHGTKNALLVHGWESRGTAMRSFVPILLNQGYRVLALDAPAHGDSEGTNTNMPHFARAIQTFISYIGNVDTLIAHSFGGASSIFALANIEQKIPINNVVVFATPNSIKKVIDRYFDMLSIPENIRPLFYQKVENLANMPLEEIKVSDFEKKTNIKKLLVIHDIDDDVVPFRAGKEIAENWKNATLIQTKGLGHYHLMKNKEILAKVNDFISSN